MRNEASDAARAPNNPTPTSMRITARAQPTAVVGKASPSPTVVTMEIAHHRPSGSEVMFASGAPLSTSVTSTPAVIVTAASTSSA
jgi:hypothetical protein